ncbi:RHS repeat-associated core domain-containing protein [Streptomyces sp. NPDC056362]|uniref:RHS repeat-associated core domain-containing protein n=1 Tax=unclassified Streptomyces TaxID=2593676 RepID=UPI0035E0AB5E
MAVTVPDWADTLLDLVGVNWPNVDEDAYREMADALREFADDLADDGQLANNHMERLLSSGHGEAMDALNAHWTKVKGKHFKDMVSAARTIADALDLAAGAIEVMKGKAVVELGVLAGQTGLAMALIPVTGGLSALLGAGAIAFTKKQLLKLITGAMEEAVGHVVGVMTEPVVASLENMAADLVVQVSMDALGVQNGVNLDQTKQAGKDGFDEGVEGAKQGLSLASAGGGSGGGGGGGKGKGFHIEHDEHDQAGTRLNGVSVGIHGKTAGRLTKAKNAQRRNRGRDDIADALDPVIEKAMGALTKSAKTMGDHVGDTLPKAVKRISADHRNNDDATRDRLARERKSGHDDRDRGKSPGDRGGKDKDARLKPDSLREVKSEPRRHGIELGKKKCANDPVDVATGEMTLPQTDLSLPGVLPLVLRRTHLSEYRFGQFFGRSWASTLDERLELDVPGAGAIWAREDGSTLVYPRLPLPDGTPVLPVEGPRIALVHGGQSEDETTYITLDVHTGLTRSFTGSPYRASPAYWLTMLTDRNHNRITFSRRPDGTPTVVTHDGGYTVQLRSDSTRIRELSLRTAEGPVTVLGYGYDELGNLTEVTNSSGRPMRFTYSPEGRITSWTDRNDSTFRYVYDAEGRVVSTAGPDGYLSSTFAYGVHPETGDRVTRYTNSQNATTTYVVNRLLQITAEIDPLGHATRFEFDAHDHLLVQTDALGRSTRFERDEHGNLVGLVAPDGVRTTATYSELHQPEVITERAGISRSYGYDERGNLTVSVDPAGARTEYAFTPRGHLCLVRDALGASTHITTDAAGLRVQLTRPDGSTASCTRDAFGRVVAAVDAAGGIVRQGWSVEGKLTWRELPDGSREDWTWDGEGNLVSHTDRMGRTSTHSSGPFDLLLGTQTGEDSSYRFTHDTELRLTAVTNADGLVWEYSYDAAGRLAAERDFDGRLLTYERDACGRLVRRTNAAGQSLGFDRDVLGRVTHIRHDDGSASHFDHDESGHVAQIVNAHSRILLERDPLGRVVSETVNGATLSFAYDALGRRVARRTPSGAESRMEYAPGGLASYTAGEHVFRFERDALGRETARFVDDSLEMRQDWDPVGRITHTAWDSRPSPLLRRSYTYQADGVPTSIEDSLAGRRTFALDDASRVREVQARGWTERYAYNAAGDQSRTALSDQAPGQAAAGDRHYEGTRLTRAGRTRYSYDAQGRLTLRRTKTLSGAMLTWHFQWDAEDRLTQVQTPEGDRWRYLYDALGRRLSKQRLGRDGKEVTQTTTFCWDGAQLAEQRDEDTTLVWDYAGAQPLGQRETKTDGAQREIDRRFFAIVTDLVGSPTELVSADGSLAWRARSTAWGATQWNTSSTAYTPLRYPGQYFDPETGLHYNFNRYYDPEVGRYLSPDPLGIAPSINHYSYVVNPFVLSDPLGLAACEPDPTWGGQVRWVRDDHGRPFEMHAVITRNMLDEGTHARNSIIPPGYQPDKGQARGHMLARQLGGSGDIDDNLFTISQNPTNTPQMSMFEQSVYDAVYDHDVVQYSVYLEYADDDPDSPPKTIQVEAFGTKKDRNGDLLFDEGTIFNNPAHLEPRPRRRP